MYLLYSAIQFKKHIEFILRLTLRRTFSTHRSWLSTERTENVFRSRRGRSSWEILAEFRADTDRQHCLLRSNLRSVESQRALGITWNRSLYRKRELSDRQPRTMSKRRSSFWLLHTSATRQNALSNRSQVQFQRISKLSFAKLQWITSDGKRNRWVNSVFTKSQGKFADWVHHEIHPTKARDNSQLLSVNWTRRTDRSEFKSYVTFIGESSRVTVDNLP